MDIIDHLETLISDLDFRGDQRPNCDETADLGTIATELLGWARKLSDVQAEVEHAHYKLELLSDDNADLIEICHVSLEDLRGGNPDGVLDAISRLQAAYRVGDHGSPSELVEEREPENQDPPETFPILSAPEEEVA